MTIAWTVSTTAFARQNHHRPFKLNFYNIHCLNVDTINSISKLVWDKADLHMGARGADHPPPLKNLPTCLTSNKATEHNSLTEA